MQTSAMFLLVAISAMCHMAAARMAYQLPASARDLLSEPLQESFSCEDLPYGYYADVGNNCQIFHICMPLADEIGALVSTDHFSFMCGNGTIFNQQALACTNEAIAPPCGSSQDYFLRSNDDFGTSGEFLI